MPEPHTPRGFQHQGERPLLVWEQQPQQQHGGSGDSRVELAAAAVTSAYESDGTIGRIHHGVEVSPGAHELLADMEAVRAIRAEVVDYAGLY